MKSPDILFAGDRLTIRQCTDKQKCTVFFCGECDFRNPNETLGPTLKTVAADLQTRQLVIDFCELTYMNSAAVTPILMFIKSVVSKGCPVHLVYNAEFSWQRTTASAMRALINSLKILTVSLRSAAGAVS